MAICIGIDAAKVEHWAVGIDDAGQVVLDRAVENNLAAIDAFISDLRALKGDVVIGIDVVGSFARFIGASLLAEGFALLHTPGIAVNRAGQGFAGGERTSDPRDPRDARTVAELVRTRDLRPVLGAVLTVEFLAAIGNIGRVSSADALAAAAGLAPVQRQSGKPAGWRHACGGDKAPKRVCYQSAFCAVTRKGPLSKAF